MGKGTGDRERSGDERSAQAVPEPGAERRASPLWPQLILLVGFLVVLLVGVFTVLIPELSDAGDGEREEPGAEASEASEAD